MLLLFVLAANGLTDYWRKYPHTVSEAEDEGWVVDATCYKDHGRFALKPGDPEVEESVALWYDWKGNLIGLMLSACSPFPPPYEIKIPFAGDRMYVRKHCQLTLFSGFSRSYVFALGVVHLVQTSVEGVPSQRPLLQYLRDSWTPSCTNQLRWLPIHS